MILTIDIGNTSIAIGGFCGEELKFVLRVATDPTKTEDEYESKIVGMLDLHKINRDDIEGAIISSVVPPLNATIRGAIERAYGVRVLTVSSDMETGIEILCDSPSTVGADIICSCVAARELYGAPMLIIDMGTATKMIATDESGAFVGVSIIPGVMMGLNALSSGTAQLPRIGLEAPRTVIGKNTVDCMKSGVIFGHACMLDGMIDRILAEQGRPMKLLATGGYSDAILPHCTHDIPIAPSLVLEGLNILYRKNK